MTLKSGFRMGWVKVIKSYTSEFLTCYFLLVINSTRDRVSCIVYETHLSICPPSLYFATPLAFNGASDGGVQLGQSP